jgi:hypothetical protein
VRTPNPHDVPSSGAHSLSTVCSAPRLAGLFHPTTESRTHSRPGVFPLHAGVLPHRDNSTPSSLETGLLTCKQMATSPFLDPEVLLHMKPCTLDLVINLLTGHSPHRVLVLLQVLLPPQIPIPQDLTPMTFTKPILRNAQARSMKKPAVSGALATTSPVASSPKLPTCASFASLPDYFCKERGTLSKPHTSVRSTELSAEVKRRHSRRELKRTPGHLNTPSPWLRAVGCSQAVQPLDPEEPSSRRDSKSPPSFKP